MSWMYRMNCKMLDNFWHKPIWGRDLSYIFNFSFGVCQSWWWVLRSLTIRPGVFWKTGTKDISVYVRSVLGCRALKNKLSMSRWSFAYTLNAKMTSNIRTFFIFSFEPIQCQEHKLYLFHVVASKCARATSAYSETCINYISYMLLRVSVWDSNCVGTLFLFGLRRNNKPDYISKSFCGSSGASCCTQRFSRESSSLQIALKRFNG